MTRRPPWLLGVVLLCTLGVFLPALRGDYVDDDLDLLAASPTFAGIGYLWDAIRSPFWGFDLGYWRPLTSALMCVGHELGQGHPWPTHACALLAHLLATTLAYAILRRLDVEVKFAALAAALFALHPCQVESVAWVAALGDPLVGLGSLASLLGWIVWRQCGAAGWPVLAWFGFAFALAGKESGLMALGWIAAAELVLRRRGPTPRLHVGALGFLLLALAWLGLRMLVFGDARAGFDRGQLEIGAHGGHAAVLRLYLWTGFAALPTGWLGVTPYRWIPPEVDGLVRALGPQLALTACAVFAAMSAARARRDLAHLCALGFGIALAPAALLPASLGPWPLVDRYLYLAMFGVAAVLIGCGRCRVGLAITLVVVCAAVSIAQVPRWRTHEAVVARALADCARHPEPHYLLGNLERARAEGSSATPGQANAQAHGRTALAAYARVLSRLKRPLYAGEHLRRVLGLNAELGAALTALTGSLKPMPAIHADLVDLARRHPDSAQVQLALGVACATARDLAGAEVAWLRALALDPTSPQAAFNLERLYSESGRHDDARRLRESLAPR